MPGKINVYNLGSLGVDLVRSPLHIPDGAWRHAQNAEFPDDEGEGGLKKRGSLTRLNAIALAGSIQSFTNVPLDTEAFGGSGPGVIPLRHLIGITSGGAPSEWRASADGATYAIVAALTALADFENFPHSRKTVTFGRKMFFVTTNNSTTNLTLYSWDGTTQVLLKDLGTSSLLCDLIVGTGGVIYIATLNAAGSAIIVYWYRPSTGALTQIGNTIALTGVVSLALAYGRLFLSIGTATPGGFVYSIAVGAETTWTLDETFAGSLKATQLITFGGVLYAATTGNGGGTVGIILARDSVGTWTTSFSGPNDDGVFWGFVEFNGDLYVAWLDQTNVQSRIYQFAAGVWALDLNIITTFAEDDQEFPGEPYVFDGNLYYVYGPLVGATGFTLKRTTGAVWSRPVTATAVQPTAGLTGA